MTPISLAWWKEKPESTATGMSDDLEAGTSSHTSMWPAAFQAARDLASRPANRSSLSVSASGATTTPPKALVVDGITLSASPTVNWSPGF